MGECNFKTFTVNLKGYDKNGKKKIVLQSRVLCPI